MVGNKVYTEPLTDRNRDELWKEICTVPEEKIDFLLTNGGEEFKIRNQSRIVLRSRTQTFLLLLATAAAGLFMPILYGEREAWRLATLSIPAVVFSICSGVLLFHVQSRTFWSGFGSPIDNLDAAESITDARIRKLFNLEGSIIEMALDNRNLARIVNRCLIAAVLGLLAGATTGVFSVVLPFF